MGPTSTYPQQIITSVHPYFKQTSRFPPLPLRLLTIKKNTLYTYSDPASIPNPQHNKTSHGCYGAIPPTTEAPQSAAARRLPPPSAAPAAPPSGCRRSPGPGRPGARMHRLTCTFYMVLLGKVVWGANLENYFEQMDIGEMDLGEFCAVE